MVLVQVVSEVCKMHWPQSAGHLNPFKPPTLLWQIFELLLKNQTGPYFGTLNAILVVWIVTNGANGI